ncbi:lecithin retinol acyltransferase family protein [uncultured Algimonas sp.]|uniref:lecithin retinol acyltransferase family protein n=1 Tax=uncultured Algimonas sp. TaxID=1547920 RepID=UPI0026125B58|nr:lecithin retinol acyltransferase family protein [uncultured Algimonas sp.]
MKRYPFERTARVHPAGTLLAVRVRGLFDHVGLATGYGTVIHSSARFGRVMETDMDDFTGGRPARRVAYASPLSGPEVVVRARGRMGQRYNPLVRNCEHFVSWCVSGQARSSQLGVFDIGRHLR